jgi:hypothetical protein
VTDSGERFRDILEAIHNIQRYTTGGRQAFEQDELIQSWELGLEGQSPD